MDNPEVRPHPEWLDAYEQLKGTDHGALISYQQLEEIARFGRSDKRWLWYVAKLKRAMLIEANRHLQCVPGKGYRIVMPDEHVSCGVGLVKSGNRRMRKAMKIVQKVDAKKLTHDQMQVASEFLRRAGVLIGMARAEMKKMRALPAPQPSPALPPKRREGEGAA